MDPRRARCRRGRVACTSVTSSRTPSAGQTTTILAKATVDDLDLSGHMLTTEVGENGKPHPNGVWLAWIKTTALSDLYVVDNKFPPNGGTAGGHSHPGPSGLRRPGTITNYRATTRAAARVYTAGQSFVDSGGDDEHMLRNEDPSVTAETIAVQFLPQGATRRIDEAAPDGCPS